MNSILSVTDNAINHIKYLLSLKESIGIKIGIKSGGCSGFSYYIEYVTVPDPIDELIELQNIKIFVDYKALLYLIGTEMDYQTSEFKSGFIFRNPKEKARCGCGKSFSI